MVSFCRILEHMNNENLVLEELNANSKVIGVIRSGLNIRADFWDDFLKICNQSGPLSELLGVRKEVIANWPTIIRTNLDQVKQLDGQDALQKKANLISTGY